MTTKLLDTTFLIDYWAGTEAVRTYMESQEAAEFCTTALNVKELAVGRRLQGAFDDATLRATFDWLDVLPLTTEMALTASEFEAALHRSDAYTRRQIDGLAADLLIAAVAATHDATVVTRNDADFDPFPVAVESY
jgi:predicted nucleic acid-binding protein